MSGGPTTPALVAAVSNAGAFGNLGAGYLTAEKIQADIHEIRRLTSAPFGVNLFIFDDHAKPDLEALNRANQRLDPYRKELGLPLNPPLPTKFCEPIDQQIEAVLEAAPALFSFTFGVPDSEVLERFRRKGIVTMGTATTLAEAVALEAAGVDWICAQGSEAGGHRGTFIGHPQDALIGLMALIAQITSRVKTPVIAAGGLMNGQGIAASLKLGAEGAMLGTAFLVASEAGTSAPHRSALLSEAAHDTAITRAFSGREARGIRNRFLNEMADFEAELPAYPFQNKLTQEIRKAAALAGRGEFLSLWAGQAARLSRPMSVKELVETLIRETTQAL